MLVIPFSGMWPARLTDDEKRIYHEIYDDANFASRQTIMGNGKEMVKYYSNGEASDWILSETGIIAMSPELGSQDIQSMTFDIWSVEIEAQIVMENLEMPMYLLEKATHQIKLVPLAV